MSAIIQLTLCVLALLPAHVIAQEATIPEIKSEDVEFQSVGVRLSGTLFYPANKHPEAAIVFIHGSGPAPRNLSLGRSLAREGYAVLTYDKRGVERSGGIYEGERNVSSENLALLAQDAAAGLDFVSRHSRSQGIPAGFLGLSQAGWIAPIAAAKSSETAFIVLISGPVCTVAEELYFSDWAEGTPDFHKKYTAQDVAEYMVVAPAIPEFDEDPRATLSQLSIPGLWLFGSEDDSIPVDLSIQRLEELIKSGHDYQYKVFKGLGHNFPGSRGEEDEYMLTWIKNIVSVKQ